MPRTRGGIECRPDVRQFASSYAAPCQPGWTGSNGGQTYRGVSAETIKFVLRRYGDSPENAFAEQAFSSGGSATEDVVARVRDVFLEYFNRTYELYGRRVVLDEYVTRGSLIDEAEGGGREVACADATAITEEHQAFGALPSAGGFGPAGGGFGAFSECAVDRALFLPVGPLFYPEGWYREAHPFAWSVQVDCERAALQIAEYVGKRLVGRPARFARDPAYTDATRRLGFIGPDTAVYRQCVDIAQRELAQRYGASVASRFNHSYEGGPSTIPQQAAQAVVRFKAAGVTTIVLFADFFMVTNLTAQARSQQWGPEWVILGGAGQDFEGYARLYDQDRVDGHLFGTTYLGSAAGYLGPESEPARLYRQLTGKALPPGTDGDYFALVHLFNLLQQAGPNLTPEAIAAGAASLPSGGAPRFDLGGWSFRSGPDGAPGADHTAMDDTREVFWDSDATGFDGKAGAFLPTYGGRRFTNGQWPAESPSIPEEACEDCAKPSGSGLSARHEAVMPGRSRPRGVPRLVRRARI